MSGIFPHQINPQIFIMCLFCEKHKADPAVFLAKVIMFYLRVSSICSFPGFWATMGTFISHYFSQPDFLFPKTLCLWAYLNLGVRWEKGRKPFILTHSVQNDGSSTLISRMTHSNLDRIGHHCCLGWDNCSEVATEAVLGDQVHIHDVSPLPSTPQV